MKKRKKLKGSSSKKKTVFKIGKLEIVKKSHQAKLKGGGDGVATSEVDVL